MLARPSDLEKLASALRLPALPADVVEAEAGLVQANDLASAAGATVSRLSAKLSPAMDAGDRRKLETEIDRVNAEAARLRTATGAAANKRDQAKKAFGRHVDHELAADIADWETAVSERLAELTELLAIGVRLDQEARAARIITGSKTIAGAGHVAGLLKPIAACFTAWSR